MFTLILIILCALIVLITLGFIIQLDSLKKESKELFKQHEKIIQDLEYISDMLDFVYKEEDDNDDF